MFDTNNKEKFNSSLRNRVKELRFDNKNPQLNYEIFLKFIMSSTKETDTVSLKMNSGWYNLSYDILKPLMDEISRTLDIIRQNNFNVKTAKSMARTVKKNYRIVLN